MDPTGEKRHQYALKYPLLSPRMHTCTYTHTVSTCGPSNRGKVKGCTKERYPKFSQSFRYAAICNPLQYAHDMGTLPQNSLPYTLHMPVVTSQWQNVNFQPDAYSFWQCHALFHFCLSHCLKSRISHVTVH